MHSGDERRGADLILLPSLAEIRIISCDSLVFVSAVGHGLVVGSVPIFKDLGVPGFHCPLVWIHVYLLCRVSSCTLVLKCDPR